MDFYCEPCDKTAHSHKKRKHHIRAVLSLYDIPQAATICTHAVVFFYHLRNLQRVCRDTIRRYFDPVTLCHFYYNPVYGDVSWRKPYCLRQEELFPFLTPDQAAARMQGLYRMRKARQNTMKEMKIQFQKIFDRSTGRFYFAYTGASPLVAKQSWYPPKVLKLRGIYGTVPLIFTQDVAALIIQRKWRAVLVRQFLKTICRTAYERQWDPVRGDWKYVNKDDQTELLYKPLVLRGDFWDPNEIPDWTVHDVCIFIRRLGYKQYAQDIKYFKVDGRTLLLLDTGDYANINIKDIIHIRKIQVEIDKRWPPWLRESINSLHLVRREKLKRQNELEAAAVVMQRVYRGHRGRIDAEQVREVRRVSAQKKQFDHEISASAVWWLATIEHQNHATYQAPRQSVGTVNPPPEIKLPPLKVFGRKRTHYSCLGWGQHEGSKGFVPLQDPNYSDNHITTQFTHNLKKTGYDRRRMEVKEAVRTLQFKKRQPPKENLY
jgi:hypothetical protein